LPPYPFFGYRKARTASKGREEKRGKEGKKAINRFWSSAAMFNGAQPGAERGEKERRGIRAQGGKGKSTLGIVS